MNYAGSNSVAQEDGKTYRLWLPVSSWVFVGFVAIALLVGNVAGAPRGFGSRDCAYWHHGWPLFYLERRLFFAGPGRPYGMSSAFPLDEAPIRSMAPLALILDAVIAFLIVATAILACRLWVRFRQTDNSFGMRTVKWLAVATGSIYALILLCIGSWGLFWITPRVYFPVLTCCNVPGWEASSTSAQFLFLVLICWVAGWCSFTIITLASELSFGCHFPHIQFSLRELLAFSYFGVPVLALLIKYGVTLLEKQGWMPGFPPLFDLIALVFVFLWLGGVLVRRSSRLPFPKKPIRGT